MEVLPYNNSIVIVAALLVLTVAFAEMFVKFHLPRESSSPKNVHRNAPNLSATSCLRDPLNAATEATSLKNGNCSSRPPEIYAV